MKINLFMAELRKNGIDFFAGVPDSLLSGLSGFLSNSACFPQQNHIVAQNEGGAAALAAGYHLATGKVPCVYLQNSGIGNLVNPVASLTHPKVYGIPTLFIVGWRGEPGTKDEPQHLYQGEATLGMLEMIQVESAVIGTETTPNDLNNILNRFSALFSQGRSAALVVQKNALEGPAVGYRNGYALSRETAVQMVAKAAGNAPIVSTTGKISRELFESRTSQGLGHRQDFLTVGSMGHSVMIALGIAKHSPSQTVWCLDGDGAVLMHMGALAIVGSQKPSNLIHVVLNNEAHESVGGIPTAAGSVDLVGIASACGYIKTLQADTAEGLEQALTGCLQSQGPVLLEVKVSLDSREDLGRPTTSPRQNKEAFMSYLRGAGQ